MPQTLVRHVPFQKLSRDDAGNVLGPSIEAFRLRQNEAYLSVNIREVADLNPQNALQEIKKCHIAKGRMVGGKSIYTQGDFDEISSVFQSGLSLTARGKENDPSYAGLSGFPDECDYELDSLSCIHWCDWVSVNTIEEPVINL